MDQCGLYLHRARTYTQKYLFISIPWTCDEGNVARGEIEDYD